MLRADQTGHSSVCRQTRAHGVHSPLHAVRCTDSLSHSVVSVRGRRCFVVECLLLLLCGAKRLRKCPPTSQGNRGFPGEWSDETLSFVRIFVHARDLPESGFLEWTTPWLLPRERHDWDGISNAISMLGRWGILPKEEKWVAHRFEYCIKIMYSSERRGKPEETTTVVWLPNDRSVEGIELSYRLACGSTCFTGVCEPHFEGYHSFDWMVTAFLHLFLPLE